MKRIILFFIVFSVFGCKTKTVLVENIRNTKDSIENVELKQRIIVTDKQLQDLQIQIKVNEQKYGELIERLNISETEKQQLRETFETIVKEYNEQGVLIKESYSKRTSELIRDISKLEEQNKTLTSTISTQTELISHYTSEITRVSDMNVELSKKVQLLEKENSELKDRKQSKPVFQWWFLVIGFAGGIVAYHYLGGLFGKAVGWIVKLFK